MRQMNAAENDRLFRSDRPIPSHVAYRYPQRLADETEKEDHIERSLELGSIVSSTFDLFERNFLTLISQRRCLCCHQND